MKRKKNIALIALLGALVLAFHVSVKKQADSQQVREMSEAMKRPGKWQGRLAPDFEGELLEGGKVRLADSIGKKTVILNFFATWCGPCNDEMPELAAYYAAHEKEPILMIGVDADEKGDKVREFRDRYKVRYPIVIDRGEKLQKMYGVTGYPTTVVIGADGVIHLYQIGPVMNANVAFDPFLQKAKETIAAGRGITQQAYLAALNRQGPPEPAKAQEEKKAPQLSARAQAITEKMDCPCGCTDKVAKCGCKTAKGIKESLLKRSLEGKSDAQVIRELNREFCVHDDNC